MTGPAYNPHEMFQGNEANAYSYQPAVSSVPQPFGQYYPAVSSQAHPLQTNRNSGTTQGNTILRQAGWYYSPSHPPVQIFPAVYRNPFAQARPLSSNPPFIPNESRPLQRDNLSSIGPDNTIQHGLSQPLDPWIQYRLDNMATIKLTTRPFFGSSNEPSVVSQSTEAPRKDDNLFFDILHTLHGDHIPEATLNLYGLTLSDIVNRVHGQEQQVELLSSQQSEHTSDIPTHQHNICNDVSERDSKDDGHLKHAWCVDCKKYIPKTAWLS